MKKTIIKDPLHGYLRLEPIPSQDEVEKFYAEEFYAANAAYFNNSALNVQLEQLEFYNSRWENIYDVCLSFFGDKLSDKKVFDIGFGFAFIVNQAAQQALVRRIDLLQIVGN